MPGNLTLNATLMFNLTLLFFSSIFFLSNLPQKVFLYSFIIQYGVEFGI